MKKKNVIQSLCLLVFITSIAFAGCGSCPGDIKKDNADYGIIVTTVLPANHDTSLPYLEFMDGLIYAVNSDNNQNVYSIVDNWRCTFINVHGL